MNDNEIIKGFAVCNDLGNGACEKCPYDRGVYDNSCLDDMKTDVYNLINRQKDKIAELEAEIAKQYEQAKADILGNISDGGTSCHWCIAQHRAKAIKEFAEKIDQLLNRYSNLHKYADKAMESTEEYDDGTPIEMVSVWEVLSLEKWEMVDYETMSKLQGNIETIAKERLLSELEKDFRLLVKEMTEETP